MAARVQVAGSGHWDQAAHFGEHVVAGPDALVADEDVADIEFPIAGRNLTPKCVAEEGPIDVVETIGRIVDHQPADRAGGRR